ncbi:MAG: DNA polymerase III subunit delta [Rhodospirillales bacterium]|nr:DNA polymerase III subunit delta [Rhodospirillales bacterium]
MKLAPARARSFFDRPDPNIGAVLVFGPDRGLVRERSEQLAAHALGPKPDPFRSMELSAAQLRLEPALLADEARAFGLVPGRRLIRIRDAADSVTEAARILLALDRWEALVLFEAGDLGRKSSLRLLMESAETAVAVGCYEDDIRTLRHVIAETLAAAGLTLTPEATDYLSSSLGNDRGVTRSELEKLVLYMSGGDTVDPRTVRLEDAIAVVGDARAAALGALALAVCDGDRKRAVLALSEAANDGLEPIGLLRIVSQHLQRLFLVSSEIAAGRLAREAIGALRPPVFFRDREAFARQALAWSPPRLEAAMRRMVNAEMACKRTGSPQRSIAERACLEVNRLSASPRDVGRERR